MFDEQSRERCIALTGRDPEESYREMLLDIRVGGHAFRRLVRALGMAEDEDGRTMTAETYVRAGKMRERRAKPSTRVFGLSPRERETLRVTANGLNHKEAAAAMNLSAETVKYYLKTASRRLGARNAVNAVAIALALGLLTEDD